MCRWLQNTSPLPNKNDFLSHAESVSLQWNPKGGKRFGFLGTWEHSNLRSNIFYLLPQTLSPALSNYWESGHTITGLITATLPTVFGVDPRISPAADRFCCLPAAARPTITSRSAS